jgi:hypothetical protein
MGYAVAWGCNGADHLVSFCVGLEGLDRIRSSDLIMPCEVFILCHRLTDFIDYILIEPELDLRAAVRHLATHKLQDLPLQLMQHVVLVFLGLDERPEGRR